MPNNYDQSSTGINIDINAYYDSSLGRSYHDDSFVNIGKNRWFYIQNGNVPDHEDIKFKISGTDEQFENALLEIGYSRDEYKAMIPNEPQELLIDSYGEKLTLANYEDFAKVMNLTVTPSKRIGMKITRGYSQGDYATVYYAPDDLAKAWGKEPSDSDLKTEFDRLFWDCPVYASATINGEEYIYEEQYEYDPAAFAKWLADQSGVAYDLIFKYTPKEPSHG